MQTHARVPCGLTGGRVVADMSDVFSAVNKFDDDDDDDAASAADLAAAVSDVTDAGTYRSSPRRDSCETAATTKMHRTT